MAPDASHATLSAQIDAIAHMRPETQLVIYRICQDDPEYGPAFNRLAAIPNLRRLWLLGKLPPLAAGNAPLGRTLRLDALTKLTELFWPETHDEQLAEIEGLVELEHLLVQGKISDAGMAHAAKMSRLRKLTFYSEQPTRWELAWTEGMPELRELHATMDSTITDAAMKRIGRLVRHLQDLFCNLAGLSDEGFGRLAN